MSKLWEKIKTEPAFVLAILLAIATTATGADWKGYVAAIATAALRFVVSPVASK